MYLRPHKLLALVIGIALLLTTVPQSPVSELQCSESSITSDVNRINSLDLPYSTVHHVITTWYID